MISYGNVSNKPFNIDCRYDCLGLQAMHANVMLNVKWAAQVVSYFLQFFSVCYLISCLAPALLMGFRKMNHPHSGTSTVMQCQE